jgi:hypothetical protein
MKYSPKIDFRRKRGLIEEINRAVQSVEQDAEALRSFGARQHVTGGALDYSPSTIEEPGEGHGDGTTKPPAPGPDAAPPSSKDKKDHK